MECLRGFNQIVNPIGRHLPTTECAGRRRIGPLRAKLGGEFNPSLHQGALNSAILRHLETNQPEPLIFDPYIGCLVPTNTEITDSQYRTHYHCLATKYIDEKLLEATRNPDGPKQVVLLTDGMDTRPYRLSWPNSTLIYEISPAEVFEESVRKLKDVGARVGKTCFLVHIPCESPDIQQELYRQGFNGSRPSVWILQGFPLKTLASMEDVLFIVSSLAMKGSILVGELPAWLANDESATKCSRGTLVDKLFFGHGFRVSTITYEEIAASFGREPPSGDSTSVVFFAEHLRFSDAQMEIWRSEFQRIEEDADEDGFEEL